MMFRNLIDLTESNEFKSFVKKYGFELSFLDRRVLLSSECIIMEIYALCTEEIFYFDLFTKDFNQYSNIDRLLSEKSSITISTIYETQKRERADICTKILESNAERTLKAEHFFFTYIQLMDELLSDFLMCNDTNYIKFFSPNFEYRKKVLERFFRI